MDDKMKAIYEFNLMNMNDAEFFEEAQRIPRLIANCKARGEVYWLEMKEYYLDRMSCLCEISKLRLRRSGIVIKEMVI